MMKTIKHGEEKQLPKNWTPEMWEEFIK